MAGKTAAMGASQAGAKPLRELELWAPKGDRWRKYRGQKQADLAGSYKGLIAAFSRLQQPFLGELLSMSPLINLAFGYSFTNRWRFIAKNFSADRASEQNAPVVDGGWCGRMGQLVRGPQRRARS